MLTRSGSRQRELAIRSALGAGRARRPPTDDRGAGPRRRRRCARVAARLLGDARPARVRRPDAAAGRVDRLRRASSCSPARSRWSAAALRRRASAARNDGLDVQCPQGGAHGDRRAQPASAARVARGRAVRARVDAVGRRSCSSEASCVCSAPIRDSASSTSSRRRPLIGRYTTGQQVKRSFQGG